MSLINRSDRAYIGGRSSSGYVEEKNGKPLLGMEVTESLRADTPTTTISHVRDNVIEEKGQVEVTIVRPLLARISGGYISNNNARESPTNTAHYRAEEKNADARMLEKWRMKNSRPSKISPVPPVHNFSNHHDTAGSRSCAIEKPLKRINGDSNFENVLSVEKKNDFNERNNEALIELGALYKLLDRLRPDDLESSSAWHSSQPCCREIVQRFENLLREWASDRSRLDRCLAEDRTLVKCEKCGVIRCSETPRVGKNIIEKNYSDAEPDSKLINAANNTLRMRKIVRNCNSAVSSRYISANRKKIDGIPVWNGVSVKGGTTNARYTEKSTIKNNSEKNDWASRGNFKSSVAPFTNSHDKLIERSKMAAEKCIEAGRNRKSIDTTGGEKNSALVQTVEYLLARGNFDPIEDEKSQVFSDKTTILEHPVFREPKIPRKDSFDLHGSRDVDFHRNSDFLTSYHGSSLNPQRVTKSPRKSKDQGTGLPDDTSQRSINISQYNDGKLQSHGSGTSSFVGSSSAENLIRRWIKTGRTNARPEVNAENKNNAENENNPCGIRAGPCSNNVGNIRARIAEAIQKFANRWTISEEDSYGRRQPEYVDINASGSSDEASKIRHPDKSRLKMDNYTVGIRRHGNDEQELRGISKNVSNAIWDNQDLVPAVVSSDSTRGHSKITEKNSISALTVVSSKSCNYHDLSVENSERFERQILYDRASSRVASSRDSLTALAASKILLIYRNILECSEEMDWESFEQLVSALHPSQRELWCDICKAISNEAKRVADETGATTEVCIEINPQACRDKKGTIRSRGDEITFELDMTLRDVRAIFSGQSVSSKETKERKNNYETT